MRFAVALIFSSAAFAAQPDDFEWRGRVARGRLIDIRGINGNIHAFPSSSGEVEVVARVADEPGDSASTVEVRAVSTETGVTVCAARHGQSECHSPDQGNVQGPGARVDFFIRVPEGVDFLGRTVNGEVEAESLRSDVEAYTVNGRVRISTTGSAQARTVNGSITASLLNPFWRKAPKFSTVNGGITLTVPPKLNAHLRAATRNGKIIADVGRLRGKVTDQNVEARIGTGTCSSRVTIETINGSIQVRRTL